MIVTAIIAATAKSVIKYLTIEEPMGLFDLFKKKVTDQVEEKIEETIAEIKPKKLRKPRKPKVEKVEVEKEEPPKAEPEVKVLKFDFDPANPRLGSIELDWNPEFVEMLKEHGYTGNAPEDIVDAWLMDVCKTIGQNEFPMSDNVRYIQRRDLGDGKTEFS
jgi:hypothetical protein